MQQGSDGSFSGVEVSSERFDESMIELGRVPYQNRPMMRFYQWFNRGDLGDWGFNRVRVGHLAVDIKVPLNWYKYRFFVDAPSIHTLFSDEGGSYNLYQNEQHDWQVTVVHTEQIFETLNLSKEDKGQLSLDDVSAFLSELQQSEANREEDNFVFPETLTKWITTLCNYRHDNGYYYLSFSTQTGFFTGRFSGKCLKKTNEWKDHGKPDVVRHLDGLNHNAIYRQALTLHYRIEKTNQALVLAEEAQQAIFWGLWGDDETCASLIITLLRDESVGATKRVPAFGRLGTLQSMVLLSLRPIFTVAILFPLCYELIFEDSSIIRENPYRHHASLSGHCEFLDLVLGSSAVVLLVTSLWCIEKFSASFFPFLKETAHRDRSLVEIRPIIDALLQITAFFSVPIFYLWCELTFLGRKFDEPKEFWLLMDATISSLIGVAVYGLTMFSFSQLINFFQRCCLQTPDFVMEMAGYIDNTKTIPEKVLSWQFFKEFSLSTMTLLTLLANNLLLRYAKVVQSDFNNQPIFLGSSAGLFIVGYSLSKGLIYYGNRHQKTVMVELETNGQSIPGTTKQQLQDHEPKPVPFLAFSL